MHKEGLRLLRLPSVDCAVCFMEASMDTAVLGIDIAKDTFQLTLLHGRHKRRAEFPNDATGFAQLGRWLAKRKTGPLHACLESTGRYGDELALWLHQAGHQVSIVNPARIKAYAASQLRRNKTDQLDGDVIADFCQTQQPAGWTPPSPEIRELQALLHQLEALEQMRQQEANRLAAGVPSATVKQTIEAHLAFIDGQLAELAQQIHDFIQGQPLLKEQFELLLTLNGIGKRTAYRLVAKDLRRYDDARAAVADVGLNPRVVNSGLFKGRTRLSKIGDATLRKALYFPAIVAWQHNPVVREFCERLVAAGKSNMAVIGAAMRKLLCLAYGVLKSGQPFDPNYAANKKREKAAAPPLASLVRLG
jgi:transposase